jgi:hypothetical protein
MVRRALVGSVVALGLVACGGGGGGMDEPDAGPAQVTYYGHVRPILVENCVGCHTAGGIGPFPLDTYDAVAPLASLVAHVTRERIMPPYLADASGQCQSFDDPAWLSDAEIATLTAWDEQGEPMGDPTIAPPTPPVLRTLTGTVSTISTGVDYAPDATLTDDYRCFIADAPIAGQFYVTGYEVHPGNPRTVHHVIVYAPQDAAATTQARSMDDASPAVPGYQCFGAAGVQAMPIVLWAPGGGATVFPTRTGLQVDGTQPLIIQIHYNLLAGRDPDRTTVDLQTATSVPSRAFFLPMADLDLNLPPRMSSVSETSTLALSAFGLPVAVRVWGAFPHMHTLGRTLEVDRISSAGVEECFVDVPRWDFNWQLAYWYQTPLLVQPSDSIRITCGYDTTERTDVVHWGEGTMDEMCLNFFYVSL